MRLIFLLLITTLSFAAPDSTGMVAYDVQKNVSYVDAAKTDASAQEFCKLDLYLPKYTTKFPMLVWFHGGSLNSGTKDDVASIGFALAQIGIGVAIPSYRLSPKVKYPVYIQDAAQAVAWVKGQVPKIGADPAKLFVGGYSAGAYLTAMLAMDPSYLKQVGVNLSDIAGFIHVSPQVNTHATILAERGLPVNQPVSDEAAPNHYTRKETNPMLFIVAEKDEPGRAEQNQAFVAALKAAGNTQVEIQTILGRNHLTTCSHINDPKDPFRQLLCSFIAQH